MKRWNCKTKQYEVIYNVDKFIEEVIDICKMRGYSIEHEDGYGAFEIAQGVDESYCDCLRAANYRPEEE